MKITHSFTQGLKAVISSLKMWFLLYLVNFIAALLIVTPVFLTLHKELGHSLYGEKLVVDFDVAWIAEFLHAHPELVRTTLGVFVVVFGIYALFWAFADGGILSVFTHKKGVAVGPAARATSFLDSSKRYFRIMMKITFLSLILFTLPFIVSGFLRNIIRVWTKDVTREPLVAWMDWFNGLVFLFLLALVGMIVDYTRIVAVLNDACTLRRALVTACRFVFSHFLKAFLLFISVALLGVGLLVLFLLLKNIGMGRGFIGIWVGILFQQFYMFTRVGLRLLFFASQSAYYQGMVSISPNPDPVIVETHVPP